MWWHTVTHGRESEGGNWRMEWVASTLHTTSELGVSSINTAGAHTSASSSRLNWRPWRFKWTRPFRRKAKSGFCACAITFQTQSTTYGKHRSAITQRSHKSRYSACSFPPNLPTLEFSRMILVKKTEMKFHENPFSNTRDVQSEKTHRHDHAISLE